MPELSIITTVYDRVDCLRQAIWSVQNLNFKDYEHIIVSDCPPSEVVAKIQQVIKEADDNRIQYYNLGSRSNNWGIAPAEYGLSKSVGKYLSFLSDDNVYLPEHFDRLISELNSDVGLSFVYTSCWYADKGLFNWPYPEDCKIDLGQPVFRRSIFSTLLNDRLPFNVYGWDWKLIHAFATVGRWKFFDHPTFVFRALDYPHYLPKKPVRPEDEVTIVLVFQDSLPWLSMCLEGLSRFKNLTPVRYIFVENQPYHDKGNLEVDAFIARNPTASKIVTQAPACYDGRAHEHGLNLAYDQVKTGWTLFLDADCIPVCDFWLDRMMAHKADMIGPVPDSGISDYTLPILHPCLLLFRTFLANPPYWNKFFGRWNKLQTVDGSDWDVCRPFSYTVGIRPDIRQVKLLNSHCKYQDTPYWEIRDISDSGTPTDVLAIHIREGSKSLWRNKGGDKRNKAFNSLPYFSWYGKDIPSPFNPWTGV